MKDQQIAVKEELYQAICSANKAIQMAFNLKAREADLRQQANEKRDQAVKAETTKRKNLRITPFIFFLALILLFVPSLIVTAGGLDLFRVDIPSDAWLWYLIAITDVIAATALCMIHYVITKKNKIHLHFYEEAEKLEQNANLAHLQSVDFVENNQQYIAIIAPEFRYPLASEELERIFRLGRATTLPEAYDKLDLKLHQLKMEEGMRALITLQLAKLEALKQIEYNTRFLYFD